jgi:hypothetical protein
MKSKANSFEKMDKPNKSQAILIWEERKREDLSYQYLLI